MSAYKFDDYFKIWYKVLEMQSVCDDVPAISISEDETGSGYVETFSFRYDSMSSAVKRFNRLMEFRETK